MNMKYFLPILMVAIVCNAFSQNYTYLPENISPDSLHAPFYHGVASGDPIENAVIIWSKITLEEEEQNQSAQVNWEMATDVNFSQVVNSGTIITDSTKDFTLKVDVGGLSPNGNYFYRFKDMEGNASPIGKTHTLPAGNLDYIKLGVASCANIYYGFFNSYRQLANDEDIFAIIHLGDWIYDNDGTNAPIRIPEPSPFSLDSTKWHWVQRHDYYHFDVDLRAMLQEHPLIAIWDNHDMDKRNYPSAIRTWLDWMPVREDHANSNKLYRKFNFGDLIELNMIDVRLFRDIDSLENGAPSYLGTEQFSWFTNNLLNTDATWRLVGSQKNFTTWNLGWVADLIGLDEPFFTTSNWDGQIESRIQLKEFFKDMEIPNLMFLTGDAHMSVVADIDPDPIFDNNDYNPSSGEGSLGVEFLPSGITGRNLDDRGIPSGLADLVETVSMDLNPHQQYLNLVQNGHGILEINRDSINATICYNNIINNTDNQWCHGPFTVYNGTNHWKRDGQSYEGTIPTSTAIEELYKFKVSEVYPNPSQNEISINVNAPNTSTAKLSIRSYDGKNQMKDNIKEFQIHSGDNELSLSVKSFDSGVYFLIMEMNGRMLAKRFTIIK